jgi:hypothetical protein
MHLRKLLVLATLCWVAPLSAQQRASTPAADTDRGWACPHELEPKAVVIAARDPVGEVPLETSRRFFLP